MNRFLRSSRFVATAAIGALSLVAASTAQAHSSIVLSFGFQGGPARFEPAPEYVRPRPVFLQPQPVYVQPRPVYEQPQPVYERSPGYVVRPSVYERPRWGGYEGRREWDRESAWGRGDWQRHDRHENDRGNDRDPREREHGGPR